MCRFVALLSKQPVTLDKIIDEPQNSLIHQSREAREGRLGLNADGVGLAWYNHSINPLPGVYKSIQPAWNDQNLHHLIAKIQSTCFLGHVRASTVGDVNIYNCHPFTHQQFSFVHNGTIRDFNLVKRQLVNMLSDDAFDAIKGQTDSEHFFALLMDHLFDRNIHQSKIFSMSQLTQALPQIIKTISTCQITSFSRLNIALTDGKQLLAMRYVSDQHEDALSLYYSVCQHQGITNSVCIASEPLTDYATEWHEVPENHIVEVDEMLSIKATKIDLGF
jgi:glutamine amidotransferase